MHPTQPNPHPNGVATVWGNYRGGASPWAEVRTYTAIIASLRFAFHFKWPRGGSIVLMFDAHFVGPPGPQAWTGQGPLEGA